jgi:hypothetical protein
VAGGHHTTVADAWPPITRTSAGAPMVPEPAPATEAGGQEASVPDGVCDDPG